MRNKNSNVRVIKRKLSKCRDVCRAYNNIQFSYADLLEKDDRVVEFKCNVVLTEFDIDGTYTTDFFIIKDNGDVAIRECVQRDKITKPLNVKLLDASRLYWMRRGITDWGIVTNANT